MLTSAFWYGIKQIVNSFSFVSIVVGIVVGFVFKSEKKELRDHTSVQSWNTRYISTPLFLFLSFIIINFSVSHSWTWNYLRCSTQLMIQIHSRIFFHWSTPILRVRLLKIHNYKCAHLNMFEQQKKKTKKNQLKKKKRNKSKEKLFGNIKCSMFKVWVRFDSSFNIWRILVRLLCQIE